MRSPALISACPKAGCHAVLAFLSKRYPPLEGRSPTRYSPVCHSTQGRSPFRVRLACVRHAASVDSEPGSNSHVRWFASRDRTEALSRSDSTNTRPVMALALLLLIECDLSRCTRSSLARFPGPNRDRRLAFAPDGARPDLLTLDGLCLHVLSSFQRTGFTRPGISSRISPARRLISRQGNLSNL